MKLSPNTTLTLDLKTLILVLGFTITMVSMYAKLQAGISETKLLPLPSISATEFEMKDLLIRETVENNAKGIEDIKKQLTIIEGRLYDINNLMAQ